MGDGLKRARAAAAASRARAKAEAQDRLVQKLKEGCGLVRSFDCTRGVRWWLRPADDEFEEVPNVIAAPLERAKVIVPGKEQNLGGAYWETPYSLADQPQR